MMKSWKNRIVGIIVCASLVVGTVALPSFASDPNPADGSVVDQGAVNHVESSVTLPGTNEGTPPSTPPASDPPVTLPPGGDTATDPPVSLPGADTPTDPPVTLPGADTPTDPPVSLPGADTPTDPPVSLPGAPVAPAPPDPLLPSTGDPELDAALRLRLSSAMSKTQVSSGDKSNLDFFISYNNAGDLTTLHANKLRMLITIPAGIRVEIPSNDLFHVESKTTNSGGETILTIVFDNLSLIGGSGGTYTAAALSSANGTTAHNSSYSPTVQWLYGDSTGTASALGEKTTLTVQNVATQFQWKDLVGLAAAPVVARGIYIPDMTVRMKASNANYNVDQSRVFTEKLVFNDEFEVDSRVILTEDMLKAVDWKLADQPLVGGSYQILAYHDQSKGTIKRFRINVTIPNASIGTANPGDLNDFGELSLTFKDLWIDYEKANALLGSNDQTAQIPALTSTALVALAYPMIEVNSGFVDQVDSEAKRHQKLTAPTYFAAVDYTRINYAPLPTDDPNQSGYISKKVTSINSANQDYTDPERLLYAHPGDKVTYQLGDFGNFLKTESLSNFIVTDYFNTDPSTNPAGATSHLYPVSFTPGRYLDVDFFRTVVVRVYIHESSVEGQVWNGSYDLTNGGKEPVLLVNVRGNVGGSNPVSQKYRDQPLELQKISKIEFDFSNNAQRSGFRPSIGNAPTITALVKNNPNAINPDPDSPTDYSPIVNVATVSYKHNGTSYDYVNRKDTESNNFISRNEIKYVAQGETIGGSKTFVKVGGKNPTSPKIEDGDLLEYSLTFKNTSTSPAQDPFVDDTFTGQVPYIVRDPSLGYDLSLDYGSPPFVKVVSVRNESGRDVTDLRALTVENVYIGPVAYQQGKPGPYYYSQGKEPEIKAGSMRIRLNSSKSSGSISPGTTSIPDYFLMPGDEVTISYVMKVTKEGAADPKNKLTNSFKAFGYPIYPGGEDLLPFPGSGSDGGDGTVKVNKPIVFLKQEVTRPAPQDPPPTNFQSPLKTDELMNVKLTLQNSSLNGTPPLTFYGFSSSVTTNYNALSFLRTKDNVPIQVPVKVYKNASDTSPVTYSLTMETPIDFTIKEDGVSYGTEKMALVFRNSSNQLVPIALSGGMRVELEFQMQAKDIASSASFFTQYLRSAAMFKDAFGSYSTHTQNAPMISGDINQWIAGMVGMNGKPSFFSDRNIIYITNQVDIKASAQVQFLDPLQLNDPANQPPTRNVINNTLNVDVTNVGDNAKLPIGKILVLLPKNERFVELEPGSSEAARFTATTLPVDATTGRQIVMLTPKESMILGPMEYASTGTTKQNGKNDFITLITQVDAETSAKMRNDNKGTPLFRDSDASVAFFTSVPKVSSYDMAGAIREVKQQTLDTKWGGALSGIDLTQGSMYESQRPADSYYKIAQPQPGLSLEVLKGNDNGDGNVDYKPAEGAVFGPENYAAWKVTVGLNSASQYQQTLSNATLLLKIPAGDVYKGILESAYQSAAQVLTGADGYSYVSVPLGTLTAGDKNRKTVTVSTTLGKRYGERTVEAYLLGEDEFSSVWPGLGGTAIQKGSAIPADIVSQLTGALSADAVLRTKNIKVSGYFAFSSQKTVTVPGGTPTNRGVAAPSRADQTLSYELLLSNDGGSVSYRNVSFIDRLPIVGDEFVLADGVKRGSTTKVILNGVPTVQVKNKDATVWNTIPSSSYTVDYLTHRDISPDYSFTDADFGLTDENGNLVGTPAGWSATRPADEEIAAFRVTLKGNYQNLASGRSYKVSFQAKAPEAEMPAKNAVAINSFSAGFNATMNTITHRVKPEPDYVRVTFPDVVPMTIKGTLFLDQETKTDAIYSPADGDIPFTDFTENTLKLVLYRMDQNGDRATAIRAATTTPNATTGEYLFDEVLTPGYYFVGIEGLDATYAIDEKIVTNSVQGNRFLQNGQTEDVIPLEKGKTHVRNAALVGNVTGSLTITKKLTSGFFANDNGKVNKKTQRFVFKVEYSPLGSTAVTHTFYETLLAGQSKTFNNLPSGKYVVTEIAGWATGFKQASLSYKDNVDTITRDSLQINVTCMNERDDKSFLHAIGETLNDYSIFESR